VVTGIDVAGVPFIIKQLSARHIAFFPYQMYYLRHCYFCFSQEICDETYDTYVGNFTMCPLCDHECTYWKLHSSCLHARVSFMQSGN